MNDPHLEARHRDLAARARSFGEKQLRAAGRDEEDPGARAREIAGRLGEEGLLRAVVPPPFGEMDSRSVAVARETLAYFSLLAESVIAAQGLAAQAVAGAGNEVQKDRWLPVLVSGEILGAFALAEPESGSDLTSVRTVAEAEGALWRLSGIKTWVTNAGVAGLYAVLARNPESQGSRGLSLFLVDGEAPNLAVRPIEAMAALPVGELELDGVPGVRLGDEGAGRRLARQVLEALRPGAAGAACGLAARALDETLRHVLARRQFGRPLADFQSVRLELAAMHANLEAARRLARHAAWLADVGAEEATRAATAARLFAAEMAGRVVDRAVQLHGAQGLVRGSTVERLFREARALRIREGTTELLGLELGQDLVKESR